MKTLNKIDTRKETVNAILKELDSHESVKVIYNHPKAYNYNPDNLTEYLFRSDFLFGRICFDYKRPSYSKNRKLKSWIFICRQIHKQFYVPEERNRKDNFQIEADSEGAINFALNNLFIPFKKVINYSG